MSNERRQVRCPGCELNQWESPRCRRCRRPLPKARVYIETRTQDENFSGKAPVLPLEELKRRAVLHALRKSGSVVDAASRLGIGKSTLYRMLHGYGIMEPDAELQRQKRDENTSTNKHRPEQNYLDF